MEPDDAEIFRMYENDPKLNSAPEKKVAKSSQPAAASAQGASGAALSHEAKEKEKSDARNRRLRYIGIGFFITFAIIIFIIVLIVLLLPPVNSPKDREPDSHLPIYPPISSSSRNASDATSASGVVSTQSTPVPTGPSGTTGSGTRGTASTSPTTLSPSGVQPTDYGAELLACQIGFDKKTGKFFDPELKKLCYYYKEKKKVMPLLARRTYNPILCEFKTATMSNFEKGFNMNMHNYFLGFKNMGENVPYQVVVVVENKIKFVVQKFKITKLSSGSMSYEGSNSKEEKDFKGEKGNGDFCATGVEKSCEKKDPGTTGAFWFIGDKIVSCMMCCQQRYGAKEVSYYLSRV